MKSLKASGVVAGAFFFKSSLIGTPNAIIFGMLGGWGGRPMATMGEQMFWLLVLAIPIACVAWTVTHEELFREPRDYCVEKSQKCDRWYKRKFYYLFTCEYCFSHYVTLFFLWLTRFKLLLPGWRGYLIAFFALIFIANLYLSLFGRLRLDIKRERVEIKEIEHGNGEAESPLILPGGGGASD